MRLSDICLLREAVDEPLTVSMLRRAFSNNGKVNIDFTVPSGHKVGVVHRPAEHVVMNDGIDNWRLSYLRGKSRNYNVVTMPAERWDTLTLVKGDKGVYKLVNREKPVAEGLHDKGELPMWANIVTNGLAKGRKFYFAAGGNEIIGMQHRYGPPIFDFLDLKLQNTGDGTKQTYTIPAAKYDGWTLTKFKDGHVLRTIKDEPVNESANHPLIVNLINRHLEKMGAVKINITVPGKNKSKRLGWINSPLEEYPALAFSPEGPFVYKARYRNTRGGAGVAFLNDPDALYTLKKKTDKNNNTYLELVNRESE